MNILCDKLTNYPSFFSLSPFGCKMTSSLLLIDTTTSLGTYVQVDEDLLEATTPRITNNSKQSTETNEKERGDETGDETDDEGVSNTKMINYHTLTEKQALAVQMLSNNNNGNSSSNSDIPKFQKVETNKSIPLLSLSHYHSKKQCIHIPQTYRMFIPTCPCSNSLGICLLLQCHQVRRLIDIPLIILCTDVM